MKTPDRHKHTDEHPAELTDIEARQGSSNQLNLRVLVISVVAAVVLGVILWAAFYGQSPTVPTPK